MDHAEIEARRVVDRYLMGGLADADAERFEEHYLGCRRCLDELELAQRMQDAARAVASEDASRWAAVRGLAVFAWLARRGPFVQLATIAALVLLPAAALLRPAAVRSPEQGPPAGQAEASPGGAVSFAPEAGTLIIPLTPQRGGPDVSAPSLLLELPREPRWLVFSIEVEPGAAAYRVVLYRGTAEVWRAEVLEPDVSGQLNVSFHSGFFEIGDYLLAVDARAPDGGSVRVGRHAFRVGGGAPATPGYPIPP